MLTQSVACRGLFHTATGTAYADLLVDGHRETWPIRGKRFRGWLRRRYYEATGGALGRMRSPRNSICSRRGRNLTPPSAPSTSASPSWQDASTLISPTTTGVPSKSDPTDGRSSAARRYVFGGPPAFCRCRSLNAGGRLKPSCRSSTFPVEAISCWWWHGC